MKKITKLSVGLLALAFSIAPLFSCGGSQTPAGNMEKPVEFLTAEVGETYVLPYWIKENADSVTIIDPAKKTVKERQKKSLALLFKSAVPNKQLK